MHQQFLNPATGEFTINADFVISNKTTIEDLTAYFGEKVLVDDLGNYSVRNLQIGELYFIFGFHGLNKFPTLTSFTFVLQAEPYDPNASWDDFDEAEEIKKGEFMKKWMTEQKKGDYKKYEWGEAGTSYDFRNLNTSCYVKYAQPK
jgi:hypothetical protein